MSKTIEQTYVKKSPIEHIKDLPDTYIGSIEKAETYVWTMDDNETSISYKPIQYIAGLYKIYDEIIVNAIDQYTRLKLDKKSLHKLNVIKVDIDQERNEISIYNNGEGIPVVIHKEQKIYVPEMIFGNLLTSANYDKNEKKITGGKNGYGSKLTNIFSTVFTIETVDSNTKLKYVQTFSDNMSKKSKPVITKCKSKPYTKITFQPDLKIFGLTKLDNDTVSLMKKRVVDITACTGKEVNVYLNGKKLDCKTLDKYVKYYFKDSMEKIYEISENERWEVVVVVNNDTKFEQVSFVNGINTIKGGKHVDAVTNNICRKLQNIISKKGYKRKKNIKLKQVHIKDNMFVFIRSIIENPSFDSQIKEYLTTPPNKFGSKFDISEKNVEKLIKTSLIDRALKLSEFKDTLNINKISNKKSSVLRGIPKLDDANKAGSSESSKCTLILTEGDSAKALAIAGLSVVGRDYFGVFPLRGKMLNVRDTTLKKIVSNKEISNIMKIIGLSVGIFGKKKNKDERIKILKEKLRYGRVLIFTDQDVDGSHIKGLVMNMFHSLWPELLSMNNFIISLATPIVKVYNKKTTKEFYTLTEFEDWKEKNGDLKKWKTKYYKGLGTSTSKEAKEYFNDFEKKKIEYIYSKDDIDEENNKKNHCNDALELAFLKENANKRKEWLKKFDRSIIIEQSEKKVTYKNFIDKDFKHFSNYDCERSIACLCDGLKPSLRKVLYSVFKRKLKNEIKVSQLAGYVSEHSCYHHGENSLYECIIGMAQNFVGSNNIELLVPNGQFGTRLQGGKDASAPRYIWTVMHELTSIIFNQDDNPLLTYNEDDGMKVEPKWYVPIIPMILVNGTEGIGTGFSTKVPSHNPLDLVENLIRLMDNKKLKEMKPWYRGFKGEVIFKDINEYGNYIYINKGKYERINGTTVEVTELPIGTWTDNYRDYLETLIYEKTGDQKLKSKQCLVNFQSFYTESNVKFVLKFRKNELDTLIENKTLELKLKLYDQRNSSYTNIHLYNSKGTISKYNSAEQILKEFYLIRLAYYIKRKEYLLKKLKRELDIYASKRRFIKEFINKDINIINIEDEIIYKQLEERNYPKFPTNSKKIEYKEEELSYDYLLSMYIRTFTKKKMEELKKLHDDKEAEYNELQTKTEKMLWKEDLDKFKKLYKKYLTAYNKEANKETLTKNSKKSNKKRKKNIKKI